MLTRVAPELMPTVAEVDVPLKVSVPVCTVREEPFNAPVAVTAPLVLTAPPVIVPFTTEPVFKVVPPVAFNVVPAAKVPALKIEVPVVVRVNAPLTVPELINVAIVSFAPRVKVPALFTSAVSDNPPFASINCAPREIVTGLLEAVPFRVNTPPVTESDPPLSALFTVTTPLTVVLPMRLAFTVPPLSVAPLITVSECVPFNTLSAPFCV